MAPPPMAMPPPTRAPATRTADPMSDGFAIIFFLLGWI
jgi:hypothetical protein